MGEVYRALDTRLDRQVAIKVLTEHLSENRGALQRFEREAKAIAALTHSNIVAVHDYGTHEEVSYVVTELLEGETLRRRIRAAEIPWRKAIEIGAAIADGLATAHSHGIVHRDLKPENIFVTGDGRVKILDFGLAHVQTAGRGEEEEAIPTEALHTEPGVVMGTVGYMSPEQVRGQVAGPASDIFSLGCILYEMITGRRAFLRDTPPETMTAIMREQPTEVSETGRRVPNELTRLVYRCLEKVPGERFQSASDLAFALRALSTSLSLDFSAPHAPLRARRGLQLAAAVLAGVALLAGIVLLSRHARISFAPAAATIDSIAVLPFASSQSDPGSDYLGDGITDSLIQSLSQIPDLKVMSHAAVARYKDRPINPQQVGRELNVKAVLTGRLTQRGDKIEISTELVDARDTSHLWGDQYDETMSNIFNVQNEIARHIADRLRLRLTGERQKRVTRHPTESPEAYKAYLQGRYYWNKRTGEGLKKSIGFFEQAIAADPGYALAYAGLADTYALLGPYGVLPPAEAAPRARAAATKALEIDPALAEAYTSLAVVTYRYYWQWGKAEEEFRRAVELNPNYATGHEWYGEYLTIVGRFDDGLEELRKAAELDPLSLIIHNDVATSLLLARKYDRAIEEYRKTLELEPDFPLTLTLLGSAYAAKGDYGRAIPYFKKAIAIDDFADFQAFLGQAEGASGNRIEADRILAQLKAQGTRRYVSPVGIAVVYLGMGDKPQAMEWLEKGYAERADWLVYLRTEPVFDSLRSDPRFQDLLHRLGHP